MSRSRVPKVFAVTLLISAYSIVSQVANADPIGAQSPLTQVSNASGIPFDVTSNLQIPDELYNSDGFASGWRDVKTGAHFIGLVNPTDEQLAIEHGAGFEVASERFTLSELQQAMLTIHKLLDPLGLMTDVKWSVDSEANAVQVRVVPEKEAEVVKLLSPVLSPAIFTVTSDGTADEVVTPASCLSRSDCQDNPLRGGLTIYGPSFACSLGFTAHSSATTHWIMTAGHCTNALNATFRHPSGTTLGVVREYHNPFLVPALGTIQ